MLLLFITLLSFHSAYSFSLWPAACPSEAQAELYRKICEGDFELAREHFMVKTPSKELVKNFEDSKCKASIDAYKKSRTGSELARIAIGVITSFAGCISVADGCYIWNSENMDDGASKNTPTWDAGRAFALGATLLFIGSKWLYNGFTKQPSKQHYQKMLAIDKLKDDALKRNH